MGVGVGVGGCGGGWGCGWVEAPFHWEVSSLFLYRSLHPYVRTFLPANCQGCVCKLVKQHNWASTAVIHNSMYVQYFVW